MAGTYSGDPASSPLDEVRFLSQDVGPIFQLTDEEIAYLIVENATSPLMAAADVAAAITMKFAVKVNKHVGRLRIDAEKQFAHWAAIRDDLRKRAKDSTGTGTTGVRPVPDIWFAGGDDPNPRAFKRSAW